MRTHYFLWSILFSLILAVSPGYAQSDYEVYVSSRGTNSVKRYDSEGKYLGNFVAANDGGLSLTEDILFHPDGSVLVSGFGNNAIKRYDGQTGEYIGNFSSGYTLASPSKMSIGPDSLIYITQWGATQNSIARFTLGGDFVDEFGSVPAPNGLGHVWDSEGNLYVAIFGQNGSGYVLHYDPDGNSLGPYLTTQFLSGPTSIWFGENGEMFVEDWTLGRIVRFAADGEYEGIFTSGLTNPEGAAFTPDGNILVGDWGEDAIHLIDSEGKKQGYFASGNGLLDPNSVKIRPLLSSHVSDEKPGSLDIRISPNPGPGPFHILVPASTGGKMSVQIIAENGQKITGLFHGKVDGHVQEFTWTPGGRVPPGKYFVQVNSGGSVFLNTLILLRE